MNRKCLICQRLLNYSISSKWIFSFQALEEKFICEDCLFQFEKIEGQICNGCGRKWKTAICDDCHRWQGQGKQLLKNRALYCYQNEAMRSYFEQYKFQGDYYLRKIFQAEFQQFILKLYPPRHWKYCVIPVDNQTLNEQRYFNQVEGLVENLKVERLLRMKDQPDRIKQSHKNRQERLKTSQPFELIQKVEVADQAIVLIDDIYTTGQTLYHAQDILLKAGANKVVSVTLAR